MSKPNSPMDEENCKHGSLVCEECAYDKGREQALDSAKELANKFLTFYEDDVFLEPPTGMHGKTVDACSARAIRHILKVVIRDLGELKRAPSERAEHGAEGPNGRVK